MGRYYYNKKSTVDDYSKKLSVFKLLKDEMIEKWVSSTSGTIRWTRNGEPSGNIGIYIDKDDYEGTLRVSFTQTDRSTSEVKKHDYNIQLVSTPCHLWGRRWWFICPCRWNRCAKLYLQDNGIFASRKTLDLSYESRNTSRFLRSFDIIFWKWSIIEIEELGESIKYPFRNGKLTRKMKQYLKKAYPPYTKEKRYEMEMKLLAGKK